MKKVQTKLQYWDVNDLIMFKDQITNKEEYTLVGECILEGYKKPTKLFFKKDRIYVLEKGEYKSAWQLNNKKLRQALLSWCDQVNPVGCFELLD